VCVCVSEIESERQRERDREYGNLTPLKNLKYVWGDGIINASITSFFLPLFVSLHSGKETCLAFLKTSYENLTFNKSVLLRWSYAFLASWVVLESFPVAGTETVQLSNHFCQHKCDAPLECFIRKRQAIWPIAKWCHRCDTEREREKKFFQNEKFCWSGS
jgi:hypothetical protein